MADAAIRWISPDEYLLAEKESDQRHEYYAGQVFAMAGASVAHQRIQANLARLVGTALRGSPCEPLAGDARVRVDATGLYTYPDLAITCDAEVDSHIVDTLLNPIILVEILSPSTERYDTTTKFDHYAKIPSLREVWFVSQERRWVERNRRFGEGQWLREWHVAGTMEIEEPRMSISIDEVYERVALPENPPLR